MNKKIIVSFTGIAAAALGLCGPASAEEGQSQATRNRIEMSSNAKLIRGVSAEDRKAMSQAAGRILLHVEQARQAVDENNRNSASDNINKALTLAKIIESNAPKYRVDTTISSGDLQYKSDDEFSPMMIPVVSELERSSIVAPLHAAREQAQNQNQQGQAAPMRVADVDYAAATLTLDVGRAKRELENAQQALNENNLQRAGQSLNSLQQGVVIAYAAIDAPLVRARENLGLAKMYAEDGQTEDARQLLSAVSNALSKYEKNAPTDQSKQIESLRKQIETASNRPGQGANLPRAINEWQAQLSSVMG